MGTMFKGLAWAFIGVSFAGQAAAQDRFQGERLAKQWCASCHVVSTEQKTGTPDVPTFSSVAQNRDITAEWLALFLLSPHPKMPDMSLTRNEAADLAAYIRTQK